MSEIIRNKLEGSGEHRLICAVLLTYIEDCNKYVRDEIHYRKHLLKKEEYSNKNIRNLEALIRLAQTPYTFSLCSYVGIHPDRLVKYLKKQLKQFE